MADGDEKQQIFMSVLENYQVLLKKSQAPTMKAKKERAADEMLKELATKHAIVLTLQQFEKKLNNLKTELTNKTDLNQTGNKPIVLKEWEKHLLRLMGGMTNPAVSKVPGAIEIVGTDNRNVDVPSNEKKEEDSHMPVATFQQTTPVWCSNVTHPIPEGVRKRTYFANEDPETRNLTTAELRRLVLLEQLSLIRLKKQKLLSTASKEYVQYVVPESPAGTSNSSVDYLNDVSYLEEKLDTA